MRKKRRNSDAFATPTGLEPATFAVTGRRANQLRYGALCKACLRTPNGIRTRATAVKGRRPRPLDDGGLVTCQLQTRLAFEAGKEYALSLTEPN
ncbi:MAG: hypothetical protein RL410_1350 [Actinomycetota bacterium]